MAKENINNNGTSENRTNRRNVSEQSSEELLLDAKSGDSSAFEEIAKRYEKAIQALAHSFNVPESERDDLYQEGLIALYRAVSRYDESVSKFSTFATTCIKRAMLTWIRDHVAKNGTDGNSVVQISQEEIFEELCSEASESCPEELYISKETVKNLISEAIKKLSDYEKCVFLMYLEEMTSSEIAEALGRTKKSAENALDRIRKKLSSVK